MGQHYVATHMYPGITSKNVFTSNFMQLNFWPMNAFMDEKILYLQLCHTVFLLAFKLLFEDWLPVNGLNFDL